MQPRLVGGILVLLTVLCISPGAAEAGCYHRGVTRTEGPDHFLLLRDAGAMEAGSEASAEPQPPMVPGGRREGCSGPSCSDRSEVPAMPVSITAPRMTDWAVIDVPPITVVPDASPADHDDRDARPILVDESIFHPPRRLSHS